jgi:isopenicillin N synthase-like dioxygenase
MSFPDSTLSSSPSHLIPLIELPQEEHNDSTIGANPPSAKELQASQSLVQALQTSGLLLISSPTLLSSSVMSKAIKAAQEYLSNNNTQNNENVIVHPTDPKRYSMMNPHALETKLKSNLDLLESKKMLLEYSQVLTHVKTKLLRLLALGLNMGDANYFIKLHSENNHAMRILHYPPCTDPTIGNRCNEHSDYGTLTLLTTNGVSGLEIYHTPPGKAEGDWVSVPHVPGSIVVNIGSLLSEWSGGKLLATLHRVAGPQSKYNNSLTLTETRQGIKEARKLGRTSIDVHCFLCRSE